LLDVFLFLLKILLKSY